MRVRMARMSVVIIAVGDHNRRFNTLPIGLATC